MILLSPHSDDAALFAAFTCLRDAPTVLTVFDSYLQERRGHPVTAAQRRGEDEAAMTFLGCPLRFASLRDDGAYSGEAIARAISQALGYPNWAEIDLVSPAFEGNGHDQHNSVALAAARLGARSLTRYLTYRRGFGKSTDGTEVIPQPEWVLAKLKAMACYESQITNGALGCWPWFMDLKEYLA